jgi:hypothetical protein
MYSMRFTQQLSPWLSLSLLNPDGPVTNTALKEWSQRLTPVPLCPHILTGAV